MLDISRETDAISRHDETTRFFARKRRRLAASRSGCAPTASLILLRCSKISWSAAPPRRRHVGAYKGLQIPRKTPTTTFILKLRIHGDVARVLALTYSPIYRASFQGNCINKSKIISWISSLTEIPKRISSPPRFFSCSCPFLLLFLCLRNYKIALSVAKNGSCNYIRVSIC